MGLQLETAQIEPEITVVRVSGNLTFQETDTVLSLVVGLLERGVKKVILDLNDVQQIDSQGGVSLVRSFFSAREAKADVCVACPSSCVKELFKSTQVDTLIPFFTTMALDFQRDVDIPVPNPAVFSNGLGYRLVLRSSFLADEANSVLVYDFCEVLAEFPLGVSVNGSSRVYLSLVGASKDE